MANPDDCLYTKDHQWVRVQKNVATIGVTEHAQRRLGAIILAQMDNVGSVVTKDDACGTIESARAVAEVFAPVSGKIVEINRMVDDEPEIVNEDPYGEGWLVRIKLSNTSQIKDLLTASQYEEHMKKEVVKG